VPFLSGCGGAILTPASAAAISGKLQASTANVSFGSVPVGGTASSSLLLVNQGTQSVQISQMAVSGNDFAINWKNDVPITVSAGASYSVSLSFSPTSTGAETGQLAISSNGGKLAVGLSGTGTVVSGNVPVASLSCSSVLITGSGTNPCTVTLAAAAPAGGAAVVLLSNNSAVTVPATVTVSAGATSAAFTAAVASVSTAQAATITASAGGVSKSVALQLNVSTTSSLSVNSTSVAFGNVTLNTPATQSITLTSTEALPVTVSLATVAGAGFTVQGTLPVTLNTGQSLTLNIQFDPTVAGAATGTVTIISTSVTNPTIVVALSGTGVTSVAYEVNLSWTAPSSPSDPVVGYNVFRSVSGASSYQQLNSTVVTQTTYLDPSIQSGQSYDYEVVSVDGTGVTSSPSNVLTLSVP
jgi:hypothetical protein